MLLQSGCKLLPPIRVKPEFHKERCLAFAGPVGGREQIPDDFSFRDFRSFDIWQLHRAVSPLLLNRCVVRSFHASCLFLQDLFDDSDFLPREAVEGIDKLVNRDLQGGNIRALGAFAVRLSWFHRRCNDAMVTFSGLGERRSV